MFEAQIASFGASVIDDFYQGADSIEAMAAFALERMPPRFVLFGHSMGARVALEIWRMAPHRVTGIALADTGVHKVRANEAEGRFALRDLGRRDGMAALADKWLSNMVSQSHQEDFELMERLREMCLAAGIGTYEAQITALLERPECEMLLPTIDCPVLILVGENDHWAPVAQHVLIANQVPNGMLRVVRNAGHMAPAEEPESVNQAIRDWLALIR